MSKVLEILFNKLNQEEKTALIEHDSSLFDYIESPTQTDYDKFVEHCHYANSAVLHRIDNKKISDISIKIVLFNIGEMFVYNTTYEPAINKLLFTKSIIEERLYELI